MTSSWATEFAAANSNLSTSVIRGILALPMVVFILLLSRIVKITYKSNSNSVIFYLLFNPENRLSHAVTTVCLWPEITFIFLQKMNSHFVLLPASIFLKKAWDRRC